MKSTYVYRLVVDIPEGVNYLNPPQAWLDYMAEVNDSDRWGGPEYGRPFFAWPQRRNFLTKAPADRMAERLRSYGATVAVERSQPVQWEHEWWPAP